MEGFWLWNHLPFLFHWWIFKNLQSQVFLLQASPQQHVQIKSQKRLQESQALLKLQKSMLFGIIYHTDMFTKCKSPPGSAYRCSNTNFNSQPPSPCQPLENPLTIHPPDLHLPIISSWHNKWHCGVEGSPVHPTIVALQAKRKQSLEAIWWLNGTSKGRTKQQRLQTGLLRHSFRYFYTPRCSYRMLTESKIIDACNNKCCGYHSSPVEQSWSSAAEQHHFLALTSRYRRLSLLSSPLLLPVTQSNNICYLTELLAVQRKLYLFVYSANISRIQILNWKKVMS